MVDVSSDAATILTFAGQLMGATAEAGKASAPLARVGDHHFVSFGEGAVIMQTLQRGTSDFDAFFRDLGTGVEVMTNAAIAIAASYADTDDTNGNDLDVVDFAFADGPQQGQPDHVAAPTPTGDEAADGPGY